jgi:hypothetical protein
VFRRLPPVLSLNRAVTNCCACFLNYLGALARKPSLRCIGYLGDEYRRNRGDVGFFLEDTTSYGSIRPQDSAEVLILKDFEFTIHELPRGYSSLRRVSYGGAVSDRGPDHRGVYQPGHLKAYTSC